MRTAVCANHDVALVENLGADRVVAYLTSDFTDDLQRCDVVITLEPSASAQPTGAQLGR